MIKTINPATHKKDWLLSTWIDKSMYLIGAIVTVITAVSLFIQLIVAITS